MAAKEFRIAAVSLSIALYAEGQGVFWSAMMAPFKTVLSDSTPKLMFVSASGEVAGQTYQSLRRVRTADWKSSGHGAVAEMGLPVRGCLKVRE